MFEVLLSCLKGIWMHPCFIIPAKVASDFGIWVTCVVKIMPWRDGWGWHPPQTASHIQNTHIKCVWGIVLLFKGILVHPYTIPLAKLAPYFGFWVTWEWKLCHYIMVEADIHLRLVPKSIADICKMFELLVCCLTDISCEASLPPLNWW